MKIILTEMLENSDPIPTVVLSKAAIKNLFPLKVRGFFYFFYLSAHDSHFLFVTEIYRYQHMMETGITSVRVGKIQAKCSSTKMDYCTCTALVSRQDTPLRLEDP